MAAQASIIYAEEADVLNVAMFGKSHIYPKFIWDFLKDKGGSRFRSVHAPTKVMQDGEKDYLLGNRAEQMFSLREKWFAEHIFMPFCDNTIPKTKVSYDNQGQDRLARNDRFCKENQRGIQLSYCRNEQNGFQRHSIEI